MGHTRDLESGANTFLISEARAVAVAAGAAGDDRDERGAHPTRRRFRPHRTNPES
jgi:hypothetical protein